MPYFERKSYELFIILKKALFFFLFVLFMPKKTHLRFFNHNSNNIINRSQCLLFLKRNLTSPKPPSIQFLNQLYPFLGHRVARRKPDYFWVKAGYTLGRSPAFRSTNQSHTHTHHHSHLETISNQCFLCFLECELWRKLEFPEKTHAFMRRTSKLHTERSQLGFQPGPCRCEAKALTTAWLCSPFKTSNRWF